MRVKTLGFSSLTYMKPTRQILASCIVCYPSKSFRWVVMGGGGGGLRVSLVFIYGPKTQRWDQAEQYL